MGDPPLSPHTLLRLAPGVRTRLDAVGHVLVDAPDGAIVDVGPRGFAALAMFARPLALRDAIGQLESGECTATDFLPTVSVINMLIDEGALVPADAGRGPTRGGPTRWSMPACSTTTAGMTGVTAGTTAVIDVADQGCCADRSMGGLISRAPSPLSRTTRVHGSVMS